MSMIYDKSCYYNRGKLINWTNLSAPGAYQQSVRLPHPVAEQALMRIIIEVEVEV